jgi:replication-associated recombination protein RarA
MQLHEEYRPATFEDVVGQDEAVAAIRRVLRRGWGGRAWWIVGPSGTGKTTLAKLIAQEGAAAICTDEADACSLNPADVKEFESRYRLKPIPWEGKAGQVVIVNECHGLRRDTIKILLDALERLPEHAVWIFTTTPQGQTRLFDNSSAGDAWPLASRCHQIVLASGPGVRKALAKRARQVARLAGLEDAPEAIFEAALVGCQDSLRAVLQLVESGQLASAAGRTTGANSSGPLTPRLPSPTWRKPDQGASNGNGRNTEAESQAMRRNG